VISRGKQIQRNEVRTKFLGETNTFVYDNNSTFVLDDAIKISAEHMLGQLKKFFAGMLEHTERMKTGGDDNV
jgi:hypothetical protein